jgi:hypothetical protein
MKNKSEGGRRKDERAVIQDEQVCFNSLSFILHPSSLIVSLLQNLSAPGIKH